MQQARISIGKDVLGRSAAGLVYTKLSLEVNGLSFPHAEWTDFAIVVLSWWCAAALRLLEGQSGPVEVSFMDGPFLVEVRPISREIWHLALVENGLRPAVKYSASVESNPFVESILHASKLVLQICQDYSWWSSDAEALASAAAALREKKRPKDERS